MRIISSFHDYYDCIQDPTDKANLFVRETEKIEQKTSNRFYWDSHLVSEDIGFCGKIYRFHLFRKDPKSQKFDLYWNWEELKPLYEKFLMKKYGPKHSYFWEKQQRKKRKISNKVIDREKNLYIFRKYSCAYFHINRHTLTINPILKDYKFYVKFPPPQAYQEIEHYLFGVIAERREKVPPVSDKDLIIAKGFDLKTSFRKEKQK